MIYNSTHNRVIQRILFVHIQTITCYSCTSYSLHTTTLARLLKNSVRDYLSQSIIHCNIVCCSLLQQHLCSLLLRCNSPYSRSCFQIPIPYNRICSITCNSAIRLKSTDYSATIVNISSPLTTFSFHVQVRLLSSHLQIVRCRFRCLLCCSLLFSIRQSYNNLLQRFSTHNKLLKMQFASFSAGSLCKCSIYHKPTDSMSSASLLPTTHNSHTIHYSLCFRVTSGITPALSHTQYFKGLHCYTSTACQFNEFGLLVSMSSF